jgi:hypothetical protein
MRFVVILADRLLEDLNESEGSFWGEWEAGRHDLRDLQEEERFHRPFFADIDSEWVQRLRDEVEAAEERSKIARSVVSAKIAMAQRLTLVRQEANGGSLRHNVVRTSRGLIDDETTLHVTCPACSWGQAIVRGAEEVEPAFERQDPMLFPDRFDCSFCLLELDGVDELHVVRLAVPNPRTTTLARRNSA